MKVTVQYYDEDSKKAKDKVAKAAGTLVVENVRDDFQQIEVSDSAAAKALMASLSPIANIQTQTA